MVAEYVYSNSDIGISSIFSSPELKYNINDISYNKYMTVSSQMCSALNDGKVEKLILDRIPSDPVGSGALP